MQWTDEGGGAYGEDPYSGAGYAYAYGTYAHGYEGGGTLADTATLSWDPAHLAQPAYPRYEAYPAYEGHPAYPAYPAYPSERQAPRGDALTAPPPYFDPPGTPGAEPGTSGAEPGTPESESVRPVFVDSTGRRQRRVLRAARLLVIPAGGYVALLISTMLGGPTVSSPFVPQPDSTHPTTPRATAPDVASGAGHSGKSGTSTSEQPNAGPTARGTSGSTDPSAASTAPAATSGPTAAPTRTTSPTDLTATPASKGRALGSSHKPVK